MPPTSTQALQSQALRPSASIRIEPKVRLKPKTSILPNIARAAAPPVQIQPAQIQPVQNRVRVLLVHIPKLSIRGQARLAAEIGVSRSTISRLANGKINPSYRLARGVTSALERLLGYPLDMRDVFTTDGTYLTPSGCALCKCNGCFPDRYYDSDDTLKPERRGEKPGDWSLASAPETDIIETDIIETDIAETSAHRPETDVFETAQAGKEKR